MIEVVVKIGGRLLGLDGALDRVARTIAEVAPRTGLLIVPGGGPFADAVRVAYRQHRLSPTAAHWMAILGMEQMAHLLAERIVDAMIVTSSDLALAVAGAGKTPVLAPYQLLRERDPLPHSWDVTSDSIAAWVAGEVGARRLVLVKAVSGCVTDLADNYVARALSEGVRAEVIGVDSLDATALAGS